MQVCGSSAWVTYAIDGVLILAAMLVVCVMQRAEKDQQINRVDSKPIRAARRLSFVAVALFALGTIMTDISREALLLLFGAATVLLAVDAVGLNQRRPPQRGARAVSHGHGAIAHGLAPLRHLLAIFFRGR